MIKQTSASEFDRLYGQLEGGGLQIYDAIDEKLESLPIRRKDIIEVDARIYVSGLQTLLDLTSTFSQVIPLIQVVGPSQGIDQQTIDTMQAMSALAAASKSTSLVGTVPGECGLHLALELLPDGIQTDTWDIDATVVLKVQRILRPGDRHVVGDPFGGLMKMLPEAKRRELLGMLKTDGLTALGVGDAEIVYPGIIGTPIAIYR